MLKSNFNTAICLFARCATFWLASSSVLTFYSRRKVVLKETELQHIHNQHSKPSKPI